MHAALTQLESLGYPLPAVPQLRCDLRGLAAGQAILQANRVRLNAQLLAAEHAQSAHHTLVHELCHLAVWFRHGRRARAHGPEWQALMRAMGESPRRCHDLALSPARRQRRFSYRCACPDDHQLSATRHHRACNGAQYLCRRCGQSLQPVT